MARTRSLLIALAACSSSHDVAPIDDAPAADAPHAGSDAGSSSPCVRVTPPADHARHVVIAHPYDANGSASGQYEVLDLSATGTLSRAAHTFAMGPASFGTIAFTQDGELGVAADDNGKLGVFRLGSDGTATVAASELDLPYYAGKLVMDPSGANVWILDGDTGSNGGGIYRVDLACDGTPTDRGLVAAGSTPGALAFTAGGARAVIAAGAMLDSTGSASVHLLAWGTPPTRIASAAAFGDNSEIIGGAALSADGATFLVGDTNGFSGIPNRIAIVGIGSAAVTPLQILSVDDPEGIVASPFGDVAVVTDALGNKIFVLDRPGAGSGSGSGSGSAAAWRVRGEVAYHAGTTPPQLPGDVASIATGTLRGRVYVSEVDKIRQLAFDGSGGVTDLGSLQFGSGVEDSLGAIGVTP